MANGLSLISSTSNAGIFECPSCKQTVDATSTQCRFCNAPIDPGIAEAAAKMMAKVNQACSDASFLRTMAVSILVFLGLMFVPFLTWLDLVGYAFLMAAVPFMTIRWWIKFHTVRAEDRDFKRAKMTAIAVSVLGSLPLLIRLETAFL